jgi:hypothetical protein
MNPDTTPEPVVDRETWNKLRVALDSPALGRHLAPVGAAVEPGVLRALRLRPGPTPGPTAPTPPGHALCGPARRDPASLWSNWPVAGSRTACRDARDGSFSGTWRSIGLAESAATS